MRYIALLRGVNVGGNNPVPMAELKLCFEEAGFENVKTYINSGNILFDSAYREDAALSSELEKTLSERFGFQIDVAVLSAEELADALENAPEWWGSSEPGVKRNAIFVIPPAKAEQIAAEVGVSEYERVCVCGNVIFWSASAKTLSRTKWLKAVGKSAYKSVTIRNSNTAKKLNELCE